MNFDANRLAEQALPWLQQNWQLVAGIVAALFVLSILRRLLSRPRAAPAAASVNTGQSLDTALAAAAEINADIEAYARTLFTEEFGGHAARLAAEPPKPVRFATIGEAPFVYDGVIMRDVALLPSRAIGPVSAHFRQGQTLLDALRRLGGLDPAETSRSERLDALRATIRELNAAIDKATDAAEKLDAAISKAGGSFAAPRSMLDLGTDLFKGYAVDRPGQRAKFYRALRDQSATRAGDIIRSLDVARVSSAVAALPAVEPVTKDMKTAAE
ncbi:MAG: hypothetical protein ACRCUX_15670 [Beijerinckiaceae bacterium]